MGATVLVCTVHIASPHLVRILDILKGQTVDDKLHRILWLAAQHSVEYLLKQFIYAVLRLPASDTERDSHKLCQ
jgi:hypothetical protein